MGASEFRLPRLYVALLESLRERGPNVQRTWLGDVGFAVPTESVDAAWEAHLTAARWNGMHPDLMPFAEDGFGNQFCFYRSARDGCRANRSIVYWMYETYRAVPVASTFEGFLGWLQLMACVEARGGDPVVDRAHVDRELMPLMNELGCAIDPDDVLDEPDPTPMALHRAHLRVDANAAAPRVALASHASRGNELQALDLCAEATFSFPEFAGARAAAARILSRSGDTDALAEALFQTLQRPLVYGGDPFMHGFRGVPEVDASWTAERLAAHTNPPEHVLRSPLWTLVIQDDPLAARSWVQLALDFVQEEELEVAVTMATNALFLGFGGELGGQIHGLLVELYDALEWTWHRDVCARFAGATAK
ncbi:MAG: SMI1/KNR4 family protein [Myxococcales bacterium]|nr:SMI1/KNR4 family protein [Myxococcales bacterium]